MGKIGRWVAGPLVALVVACATNTEGDESAPVSQSTTEELSSINCTEHAETGYVNGNPFQLEAVTVDGHLVQVATADAYYVMAEAANNDGVHLAVISGFRTMAEQQYLFHCYKTCTCNSCNLAAVPGTSNHQSGHAIDFNTDTPGVYGWLENHAAHFGFKRTVPSEIWHWEWWGGGPGGGPCGKKPPPPAPTPIPPAHCGRIDPGEGLRYGASAWSCDGRFHLEMQLDGNLVLYEQNHGALWSTATGAGHDAEMQSDGNFVEYDAAGREPTDAVFATNTSGHGAAHLAIQDDGNVVLYDGQNAIWSTHTCCR
jgi:hypothetical protein